MAEQYPVAQRLGEGRLCGELGAEPRPGGIVGADDALGRAQLPAGGEGVERQRQRRAGVAVRHPLGLVQRRQPVEQAMRQRRLDQRRHRVAGGDIDPQHRRAVEDALAGAQGVAGLLVGGRGAEGQGGERRDEAAVQRAVRRHRVAAPHPDPVAGDQPLHRHLDLAAILQHQPRPARPPPPGGEQPALAGDRPVAGQHRPELGQHPDDGRGERPAGDEEEGEPGGMERGEADAAMAQVAQRHDEVRRALQQDAGGRDRQQLRHRQRPHGGQRQQAGGGGEARGRGPAVPRRQQPRPAFLQRPAPAARRRGVRVPAGPPVRRSAGSGGSRARRAAPPPPPPAARPCPAAAAAADGRRAPGRGRPPAPGASIACHRRG